MSKQIGKHDALVTIAAMALLDDGFTAHDVLEVLRDLGHRSVLQEAREQLRSMKSTARAKGRGARASRPFKS